ANSRITGIVLIHDNPGDAINVRTKWRQLRSVVQRYGYGVFKFPGVITFGNDKNNDLRKVELFNRDGLFAQYNIYPLRIAIGKTAAHICEECTPQVRIFVEPVALSICIVLYVLRE